MTGEAIYQGYPAFDADGTYGIRTSFNTGQAIAGALLIVLTALSGLLDRYWYFYRHTLAQLFALPLAAGLAMRFWALSDRGTDGRTTRPNYLKQAQCFIALGIVGIGLAAINPYLSFCATLLLIPAFIYWRRALLAGEIAWRRNGHSKIV